MAQSGRTDTLPNSHSEKTSISGKPITRNNPIVASMIYPLAPMVWGGYTRPVIRRKVKSGRMPHRSSPLSRIADSPVAARHDIHVAVRALPVPMHPHKLFGRAAGRAARHQMGRVSLAGRRRGAGVLIRVLIRGAVRRSGHRGPSLSFSRRRAAMLPSWNVPNHASSGKSTLP